ncbi:MAG TPA: hypothetical protein VJQ43_01000 [Thermoplasmata archaeon]|nr:hypothetical protein [Thermoplasmata archaeon]
MNPTVSVPSVGPGVRSLLELDRTLSPSDRKLLEVLLLRPGPTSARELSRRAGTNLQALYGALDRLEQRGFVVRDRHGAATTFRSTHPSVILHSLVEPGRKAAELAAELERPLGRLYESGGPEPETESPQPAASTASPAAASSWLIDLVGRATGDIWFLGNEAPWFAPAPSLEREIARRRELPHAVQVRMLVPPPQLDDPRSTHHERLQAAGVEVRYSVRFAAPAVIVDRRWLMLRTGSAGPGRRSGASYIRLESPELCQDLLGAGEDAWSRSAARATPHSGAGASAERGRVRLRPIAASRDSGTLT